MRSSLKKERPSLRKLIVKMGYTPYMRKGIWDTFCVNDPARADVHPCLGGILKTQFRKMVAEGFFGHIPLPAKQKRSHQLRGGYFGPVFTPRQNDDHDQKFLEACGIRYEAPSPKVIELSGYVGPRF